MRSVSSSQLGTSITLETILQFIILHLISNEGRLGLKVTLFFHDTANCSAEIKPSNVAPIRVSVFRPYNNGRGTDLFNIILKKDKASPETLSFIVPDTMTVDF